MSDENLRTLLSGLANAAEEANRAVAEQVVRPPATRDELALMHAWGLVLAVARVLREFRK